MSRDYDVLIEESTNPHPPQPHRKCLVCKGCDHCKPHRDCPRHERRKPGHCRGCGRELRSAEKDAEALFETVQKSFEGGVPRINQPHGWVENWISNGPPWWVVALIAAGGVAACSVLIWGQ